MPRIDSIPYEELTQDIRDRLDAGETSGMYTTLAPMLVVAQSPVALVGLDESYKAIFKRGALGQRLQELLRIRSAQINMCAPCSVSIKDDSLTSTDVSGLAAPDEAVYTRREVLALRFLELFANDHHAIDDTTFKELREEFNQEEVVELGYLCAQFVGGHRFMHVLDVMR